MVTQQDLDFITLVCPKAHIDEHNGEIIVDDMNVHRISRTPKDMLLDSLAPIRIQLDRKGTRFYPFEYMGLVVSYMNSRMDEDYNLNDFKIAVFTILNKTYFNYFDEPPFESGEVFVPPEGYVQIPDPIDPVNNPKIWIPPNWILIPEPGVVEPIVYNSEWANRLEGDGSFANPYLIYTPYDFMIIKERPTENYVLMNNLDFTKVLGLGLDPLYRSFDPENDDLSAPLYGQSIIIQNFSGSLQGNYHILRGLNIVGTANNTSLFTGDFTGTIRNTIFGKMIIDSTGATRNYTNLINRVRAGAVLENVAFMGRIKADAGQYCALIGSFGQNTKIIRYYFDGEILSSGSYSSLIAGTTSNNSSGLFEIKDCLLKGLHKSSSTNSSPIFGQYNFAANPSEGLGQISDVVITTRAQTTQNVSVTTTARLLIQKNVYAMGASYLVVSPEIGLERFWEFKEKPLSSAFYLDETTEELFLKWLDRGVIDAIKVETRDDY